MARYLVRIANGGRYAPKNAKQLAKEIRDLFNSREAIGHLRVSSQAIEFDLFARNARELESRKSNLESKLGKIITLNPLDTLPVPKGKLDVLREGIGLFNEERYWECHEVLEQIWHPAKGTERDIIQGLILTAAALVHAQRDEDSVSLTMLKKARSKLGLSQAYEGLDLTLIRSNINRILESGHPEAFKIKL